MPGSIPATSQLDWLISTTAMIVLSWSRATRDLLKSFGWGIGALHRLATATMVPSPRRLPHSISPFHPERQRSEGRHVGPAHRSRFRSRAAVIVTLAALPILWTPNVVVARKVVGGFRVAIPGALLFAADGWIATGYVFVWQIALTRCRSTRHRGS